MMATLIAVVSVSVAVVLVAVVFAVSWRAISKLRRARANGSDDLPAIVVVRPIRGLDPGLEANVHAALAQRYPAPMETLFILDDARDPAYPVVRSLVDSHNRVASGSNAHSDSRSVVRVALASPRRHDRTGKLHAMMEGLSLARTQAPLVCFADSDTRPQDPGLIAELARAVVRQPNVGAAFAPAISAAPPRTVGDVGYCLMLDGLYGPQAAVAMARHESLPFIMGQTMVLRRSALDAAGGLRGSAGQLVDDMHIGSRIAAAGFRNVLIGTPVPIWNEGMAWRTFRSVVLRWMVFGRTGVPMWPFNAPTLTFIVAFYVTLVALLGALLAGSFWLATAFALASFVVPAAIEALRRSQGAAAVPPRLWWVVPFILALAPIAFLRARFARTVTWRGRRYRLDAAGRLAASPARRRQLQRAYVGRR